MKRTVAGMPFDFKVHIEAMKKDSVLNEVVWKVPLFFSAYTEV